MMYSHRGVLCTVSPISRFAANRDPDSHGFPAESGNGDSLFCFPIQSPFPDSGRVRNRGFPPRFPAKSGMGGTGIPRGFPGL
jgi:hypothetical protein